MVGILRTARALMPAVLVGALSVVAFAGPADAVVGTVTLPAVACSASINGGTPISQAQDLSATIDAPATVTPGSTFTMKIVGGTATLPSTALNGALTITQFTDLSSTYQIEGATVVNGSAVASGPPLNNGNPATGGAITYPTADTLRTATPGPLTPGSLVTPDITFQVVAGAVGSQIKTHLTQITTTAHLLNIGTAAVTCAVPANTVTVTSVDNPPPPGAPDAIADNASTPQDNKVNIAVLANDIANPAAAIAPSTLAISTPTKSGALADPVDGGANPDAPCTAASTSCKIRYTPPIGFSGTDTFSYRICSVPDAAGQPGTCDTAVVTVTVAGPPAAAAAAAAPAATLPATGSNSSTPWLAAFGSAILLAGAVMVFRTRTKRSRFVA